jgi:hypothetical protein
MEIIWNNNNFQASSGLMYLAIKLNQCQKVWWLEKFSQCEAVPPVADAGVDQSVLVGDDVTLDGRQSYSPEGKAITYQWEMVGRPSGPRL